MLGRIWLIVCSSTGILVLRFLTVYGTGLISFNCPKYYVGMKRSLVPRPVYGISLTLAM